MLKMQTNNEQVDAGLKALFVNILSILLVWVFLFFFQLIPSVLHTPTNYCFFYDKVLKIPFADMKG